MENPGLHEFITNQSWLSSLQILNFKFSKFEERVGTTEAGLPLDKKYHYISEGCIFSVLYTPGLREVQDSFK